ncbi:NUDIX hydrolase [Fodinibius halophilus]|uniref:NUDIX domain-containing protein n=1 Tax=Fodinibius halophilus TaxID=1736908 RepID=A0A6M1TEB1_9BACT|nr:NUDIX domain-containing protein [Fodinibius halophilus]NGP89104.1 NUDIX domain-containing protein [Fodinibius halophilus]
MSELVDVYPYCKENGDIKLLLLKRADDVIYAGQWRMIGGKVESNETATEAAQRELEEETGGQPKHFWAIPSLNQFYDPHSDTILQIPAFAVELDPNKKIELNHEHIDYIWISEDEIEAYISWPEQARLLKLVSSIVTNNKILSEWII